MFIRLSDITQPTSFSEKVGPVTLDLGYNYSAHVEPVELDAVISPVAEGHRVEGGFAYHASLPCSRCLTETRIDGETQFLIEYRPANKVPIPEEETEVTLDEAQVVFVQQDTLAWEDLVIQQMYLEIPPKTLCRTDCMGLCPRCGADLNQGPCPCPPDTDTRWAALGPLTKDS